MKEALTADTPVHPVLSSSLKVAVDELHPQVGGYDAYLHSSRGVKGGSWPAVGSHWVLGVAVGFISVGGFGGQLTSSTSAGGGGGGDCVVCPPFSRTQRGGQTMQEHWQMIIFGADGLNKIRIGSALTLTLNG